MTKGKNYNSILFLTTLSVYLGLVLVGGAAPQVLAQAALTRNFEIQAEFEVEDDLDKKPNDGEAEQFFGVNLEAALNNFIEDFRELKRFGKYKDQPALIQCTHSFCSLDEGSASIIPYEGPEWISDALWQLHKNLDAAGRWQFNTVPAFIESPLGNQNNSCKEYGLKIQFDKDGLNVTISFTKKTPAEADLFAGNLNRTFASRSAQSQNTLAKQINENTRATSKNEYVLVVTRLPRASIDALVAAKNAR